MRIGAAWIKEDKNGNKYMSCSISIPFLGKMSFALFKNDKKGNDLAPDYIIDWNEESKKTNDDNIPL